MSAERVFAFVMCVLAMIGAGFSAAFGEPGILAGASFFGGAALAVAFGPTRADEVGR